MTAKFIAVLIPSLLFLSYLPAERSQEKPSPYEDTFVSQEDTPHSTFSQLQDIHHYLSNESTQLHSQLLSVLKDFVKKKMQMYHFHTVKYHPLRDEFITM